MMAVMVLISAMASASPQWPAGWTYSVVGQDSRSLEFTSGASAVLNFGGDAENGPEISVLVHRDAKPVGKNLGAADRPWFDTLVGNARYKKIKVLRERTYTRDGKWHYWIEFTSDDGSPLPLRTTILATVRGGETVWFTFENSEPVYTPQRARVHQLFEDLKLRP